MRFLFLVWLVVLASGEESSLLETSQVLWTRILNGGFRRLGRLDPLYVPIIRVDQTEGNTTYRVILRNLEVTGLKNSRIESVRVVRGRLLSNLSDNEAGYVSYNEQSGRDSIRYRFHTLVKEPKSRADREELESFAEVERATQKYREEEDLLRPDGRDGQRRRIDVDYNGAESGQRANHQQTEYDRVLYPSYEPAYGDMRVVVDPARPSSARVVYTQNFDGHESEAGYARPCVGACRPNYGPAASSQENRQYPGQRYPHAPEANTATRAENYYEQRYGADRVSGADESTKGGYAFRGQFGGATFSAGGSPDGPRRSQFEVKGRGDGDVDYAANIGNGRFSVESKGGENREPTARPINRFSVKGDANPGIDYSSHVKAGQGSSEPYHGDGYGSTTSTPGNRFSIKGGGNSGVRYSGNFKTGPLSFEAHSSSDSGSTVGPSSRYPDNYESTVQPQNQFSAKGAAASSVNYSGSYGKGQFSAESKSGTAGSGQGQDARSGIPGHGEPAPHAFEAKGQFGGASFSAGVPGVKGGSVGFRYNERGGSSTVSPLVERAQPYKSPLIRLEKQPSYVDVVYASSAKSEKRRLDQTEAAPETDPRILGFEEIVKELPSTERYTIHRSTTPTTVTSRTNSQPAGRNDAAKIAAETKRIKDMIRYAKEFQEKEGYYEEGVEFAYHLGGRSNETGSNGTLARTKRQRANATDEEDAMHVVVRIRVPALAVKSSYALTGRVGRRQLRGNGLLVGNFSDVLADFTVELRKDENGTMVVRAARARLVSAGRDVRLQGMDDSGLVDSILDHGLMAAEAVAAMIVDDLATRALNEDNAETMVYKMYKNLQVVERSG